MSGDDDGVPPPVEQPHRISIVGRLRRAIEALNEDTGSLTPVADTFHGDPQLVPLLRDVGEAELRAGRSVMDTADVVEDVARAYGVASVRTIVLPTAIFVRVQQRTDSQVEIDLGSPSGDTLSLRQVGDVHALEDRLRRAEVSPAEGRTLLAAILAQPPSLGAGSLVLGHATLALGFALILNPTLSVLPVTALLGAVIGLLRVVASRWSSLSTGLPVLATFVVTLMGVTWFAPWLGVDPVLVIAPPVVSFLPGALLTIAAMELTSGQVVAGTSRLGHGLAQLLLLAFGVVAGVTIAGPLPQGTSDTTLGTWAPFVGIAVVSIGYFFYAAPSPRALPWIFVLLVAVYGAQLLGATVLAGPLSGFVGGLVVAPLSELIARRPSGPPAVVTSLPAFWLLVPGALSFVGVSELAGGNAAGVEDAVQAVIALFSIALGVLFGTALARDARRVTRSIAAAARDSGAPGGR
ncbi:protein of unknown function DUF1212 [Beutenbergia cavernae DSM 12333]|uniref:Threonine/serine exporter-like N-terminal domain-containing protein n=1 Tax=Beutenbergia cavernae (strain ATCC BAA-8 / DSM 12333 / CCUG 43141 / JCM 11478 / NBRC 16432 / NCIMB 13614 / HKI 0122) TaxID=471853 RepID=C5C299_BEUC1|nr:threonine/serine exporter family protein [Beutenbergia cavernae]ACQ81724.1 protein of unknown function DUF1212 [Beutenbergia cavernae DSM 12333]